MIFEQHYLECLSQASYFIGDETTGRAVVVDPRRDIAPYLESAAQHDMVIELVIETHFHADFVSGHLELAAATGAAIAYGSAAEPEFEARKLGHRERISLGEVELEIRHTPGHTPESISLVVFERSGAAPYGVLTGDTLFIGDVGRPDLLSSVGVTSEELAGSLYNSLHDELLSLPDDTRLFPGHGAGSACGKNLSTSTSCSIGIQRSSNYALQPMSKDDFVAVVTAGQTAPPAYFAYDADLNKAIRPLFYEGSQSTPMTLDEVVEAQAAGAVVLDSRSPHIFAEGHIARSINVGLEGRFSEFVGGVIPAGTRLIVVAEPGRVSESVTRLARIGFDDVIGHLGDLEDALRRSGMPIVNTRRVDVAAMKHAVASDPATRILDVRQPGETEGGVVAGALTIPLTQLNDRLGELDADTPIVLYCAGGFRSMIAASKLEQAGFSDVADLLGGYGAWVEAGEPTVAPAHV